MRWADIEVPNTAVDMNSWAALACYPQGSFYPLSDGVSTHNHRIIKPHFCACSTCRSKQSSSLMPLHSTADFQTAWGNLWAPPLLFRQMCYPFILSIKTITDSLYKRARTRIRVQTISSSFSGCLASSRWGVPYRNFPADYLHQSIFTILRYLWILNPF